MQTTKPTDILHFIGFSRERWGEKRVRERKAEREREREREREKGEREKGRIREERIITITS